MKFVASRRAPARALALLCAIAIASHPLVDAFAPVAMKGRERGARRAAADAAVVAAPPPTPASAGKASPKTKGKNKKTATQKRKKRGKQAPGKHAPKNKKHAPKQKKRASAATGQTKDRRKTAPKAKEPPRKPLTDLKLGATVAGTVVGVSDFGAFLEIGYATRGAALLHLSQISDERIHDVRSRFAVGDRVEGLRVITLDLRKGEAGLSLRPRRPLRQEVANLRVGDSVEGRVVQVVSYGAFVDVGTKVNALLHISRITGGAIENVRHHLNEGDPVDVHIIHTDLKRKTVAVSMLDKVADQYLNKRMRKRQKIFDRTAAAKSTGVEEAATTKADRCELEYFDLAIRELESALRVPDEGGERGSS